MMGKISKGGSFGGCVDYVTRKKKDNPDGTPCNEWRLIDHKDVSTMEGREGIIASFEDNLALNPDLKNPVGHISLNFHINDKDKVDDRTMVDIPDFVTFGRLLKATVEYQGVNIIYG